MTPLKTPVTPWNYKKQLEYKFGEKYNNDYDYTGYAMKYPEPAQNRILTPSFAHHTDEFKLPNHDTFSDKSTYSRQLSKSPLNPVGGHWGFKNGHDTFNVSDYNFRNNPNLGQYFQNVEPNGIPIYFGGVLLPEVIVKHQQGGVFQNQIYDGLYKMAKQKGLADDKADSLAAWGTMQASVESGNGQHMPSNQPWGMGKAKPVSWDRSYNFYYEQLNKHDSPFIKYLNTSSNFNPQQAIKVIGPTYFNNNPQAIRGYNNAVGIYNKYKGRYKTYQQPQYPVAQPDATAVRQQILE